MFNCIIVISGIAGGNRGHAPRSAGLGDASTNFLQSFKNLFLSRNLNQNIFKNCSSIEGRALETPLASGGYRVSAPKPPHCYSSLLLQLY